MRTMRHSELDRLVEAIFGHNAEVPDFVGSVEIPGVRLLRRDERSLVTKIFKRSGFPVKDDNNDFMLTFLYQGNFTVCLLFDPCGGLFSFGVSKKSPRDIDNETLANNLSLARAAHQMIMEHLTSECKSVFPQRQDSTPRRHASGHSRSRIDGIFSGLDQE